MQRVKSEKPVNKSVQIWDNDSTEMLRDCFDCTDWSVFIDTCGGANELIDSVTGYMCFCLENVIKTKSVIVYPNNKPWVNKNLKECLNKKKHAFIKGNIEDYKEKEREYRQAAFRAKIEYKNKVEEKFGSGNIRDAWTGLKTMMGVTNKGCKQTLPVHNDFTKKANELNMFYSRFDVRDTKKRM